MNSAAQTVASALSSLPSNEAVKAAILDITPGFYGSVFCISVQRTISDMYVVDGYVRTLDWAVSVVADMICKREITIALEAVA